MKILALPCPASDFYSVSSKELVQARQGRLALVCFPNKPSEVLADQLIHGRVAIESDFSSGP
jgi:hypothetical protein